MLSPSDTYAFVSDVLWPVKLCAAIVVAYLVHEYVREMIEPPDDPDGYA